MAQADCNVQGFTGESRGQTYLFWMSYLLEYVSDVDYLHVDYDRRDYLSLPQTSLIDRATPKPSVCYRKWKCHNGVHLTP